jgi:hypothetical protein
LTIVVGDGLLAKSKPVSVLTLQKEERSGLKEMKTQSAE